MPTIIDKPEETVLALTHSLRKKDGTDPTCQVYSQSIMCPYEG